MFTGSFDGAQAFIFVAIGVVLLIFTFNSTSSINSLNEQNSLEQEQSVSQSK